MALENVVTNLATASDRSTAALMAAATGGEPTPSKGGRPPKVMVEEKKAADEVAPEKPAAKKPAAKMTRKKKPAAIEARDEISLVDMRALAKSYIQIDDANGRAPNRENIAAAFDHLSVTNLGSIPEDRDMRRMALYLDTWIAGNEVNFEDLDGKVAESPDDDEEDDMLG
ncbi:hypothetical protein [Candidatus Halocynthiibacter alkanivorans]|uniref:hypothetical protein n=1 Tax=Candidatus Halocynthiibacter alkanivorans TaxID=2267619 RepID=UPI000DF37F60|nr:hypothetical protein [Candidatus Halocynthiibacter alkanivorans]